MPSNTVSTIKEIKRGDGLECVWGAERVRAGGKLLYVEPEEMTPWRVTLS